MFKTFLRAAMIAACGMVGSVAQAADVAPAAGYDWSGFYIGANVGYGWGSTDYDYSPGSLGLTGAELAPAPARRSSGTSVGLDYEGVVGGGQFGYNWQIDGLVLGVEADFSASGINGDKTTNDTPPCYIQGCSAQVDWFGTGRARLGYAINSFMPFLTGGAALVGVQGDADLGACGGSGCDYDEAVWGWTLGGGVEWGFADNWSAKAEYLYVDVGAPDFSGPASSNTKADDLDFSVARVGINYRFN